MNCVLYNTLNLYSAINVMAPLNTWHGGTYDCLHITYKIYHWWIIYTIPTANWELIVNQILQSEILTEWGGL